MIHAKWRECETAFRVTVPALAWMMLAGDVERHVGDDIRHSVTLTVDVAHCMALLAVGTRLAWYIVNPAIVPDSGDIQWT